MIELGRAAHYRKRAAEMLEAAERAQSADVRASFRDLARNWERLAEQVEKQSLE